MDPTYQLSSYKIIVFFMDLSSILITQSTGKCLFQLYNTLKKVVVLDFKVSMWIGNGSSCSFNRSIVSFTILSSILST